MKIGKYYFYKFLPQNSPQVSAGCRIVFNWESFNPAAIYAISITFNWMKMFNVFDVHISAQHSTDWKYIFSAQLDVGFLEPVNLDRYLGSGGQFAHVQRWVGRGEIER